MMAVDPSLADRLREAAAKRGYSLYSLLNRVIESYLEAERAGSHDPCETSLDYVLMRSLLSLGFTLAPPDLSGEEAWSTLGQALWSVISSRLSQRDPVRLISRALALIFGEKNVSVVMTGQLSIIITVPMGLRISVEGARALVDSMVRQALPSRTVETRAISNMVIVTLK